MTPCFLTWNIFTPHLRVWSADSGFCIWFEAVLAFKWEKLENGDGWPRSLVGDFWINVLGINKLLPLRRRRRSKILASGMSVGLGAERCSLNFYEKHRNVLPDVDRLKGVLKVLYWEREHCVCVCVWSAFIKSFLMLHNFWPFSSGGNLWYFHVNHKECWVSLKLPRVVTF